MKRICRRLLVMVLFPCVQQMRLYDLYLCEVGSEDNGSFSISLFAPDCIPADLKEPFYTDQYEQEHLKPPVASLLLSADLYCRAGSLILGSDASGPLLGHHAVIQALAQRGLYVTDQERLVTERDLRKRPLQMVGETFPAALLH